MQRSLKVRSNVVKFDDDITGKGLKTSLDKGNTTRILKSENSVQCSLSKTPLTPVCDSSISCSDTTTTLPEVKAPPRSIMSKTKNKNLSVKFSDTLVTEVRLRPKTKQKNKHKLFFTPQEYFMFRKEYRIFRAQQRREEAKKSSPLMLAVAFASNFISGLEVRTKQSSSSLDEIVESDKPFASSSDLIDSLYLY